MNLSTLLGSNASSDGMSSDTRLRISFPSGVVIFAMNSNFAVFIDLDVLITILGNVKRWKIFYEKSIFNRTGRGFSRTNLYDIKRWFAFYSSQIEFVHQAGGQLQKVDNANTPIPEILLGVPWRHQTVIVSKCDTINAALFYLNKVVEDNMSRTELEYVVKSQLYEHTGKALNNFDVTLPQPQNLLAAEIIKDPYKLDFFFLPSKFSEMDLENKLATNITRFLLELGKGFAYVGRQMELDTPSGKAYFPDMIFYHTRLKCYVVVELKIVDFMPEFIGKLNFYVSAADELLKGEGDNPSIGILLCKDKDSSVVEWSLRGITTPLGVASYQLQEVYERTLLEIKQESAEEEDSAK